MWVENLCQPLIDNALEKCKDYNSSLIASAFIISFFFIAINKYRDKFKYNGEGILNILAIIQMIILAYILIK